ncbi:c-type cytochrome [Adhaeribacter rhizoryzae]|uniref:C-type cytochrome n=1 Tax=Adhaeribacter rhizoryzae TaxID=2607907 RepID=A0A5M6D8F9_9BACT|nr:c-type cytochrome [Adhaeribacter rhizoryzae]KAA5542916.1 c-type cytochrome [Adhaeribacter rhizoryzae]
MKANFHTALFILLGFISSCTPKQDKELNTSLLLGAGFGINSATLIIQDLDSARNYYAKVLGFNMPLPEKSQKGIYDGTLSASVSFPDWSSLELLSVKDTALVTAKHSFIPSFLKHYEGVRLYSLSTSSVDTTRNWLHSQGFKTDAPQSGRVTTEMPKGWDWDDGGPQWRSIEFNSNNPPAYLPSFKEVVGLPYQEVQKAWKPYTWRKYYENHPNGVVGISSLRIVVSDFKVGRKEFKKLGLKELEVNDTLVRFKIAHNQELHLMAPKSPGDELSNFLKTRGPGVYAIRFEVKNLKDTRAFLKKKVPAKAILADTLLKQLSVSKEYAYGVQLEFIEESKEQADLAKIYNFKEGSKLESASIRYASGMYAKYCALCHGKNREGYAADFAPSLRSHSLIATTQLPRSSYNYLRHAISYGRSGTAMAPYAKSQGGPLEDVDIDLLLQWLQESSGVKKPIEMSAEPITGNVALGKELYGKHCTGCHGTKGEGVSAPALGNPMLLATASDAFLRYAISEGRDNTPMPSFKDSLSKVEIDALTAYLRSRASGWNAPEAVTVTEPLPENYVLNPHNKAPKFSLRDNRYVSAEQLRKALKNSSRMIILDARSKAAWYQTHIPGAISVPFYEEPDKFIKDIPNDSTWIVAYCACPHAASDKVVNTLRRFGYKHTAILDEGILVWAQRGYPVQYGQDNKTKK